MNAIIEDTNRQKFVTYILTLDGSLRNRDLLNFCASNNLGAELVIGIDGRNKPKTFFRDSRHDFLSRINIGRRLTNEEIACGLGHLKIYNYASTSNLSWFLVCEDDTFPREGLQASEIYQVIQDFEDSNIDKSSVGPSIIHLGPRLRGELDVVVGNIQNLLISPILNCPYGTFAYLINSQAIKMICQNPKSQHFISPCDWPTQWSNRIQFYRTQTPIFLTGDFDSSYIQHSRLESNSKNSILDKITLRARLISHKIGLTKMLFKLNGFS